MKKKRSISTFNVPNDFYQSSQSLLVAMSRTSRTPSTAGEAELRGLTDFQAKYTTRGTKRPRSENTAQFFNTPMPASTAPSSGPSIVPRPKKQTMSQKVAYDKYRHKFRTPSGGGPGGAQRQNPSRQGIFSARTYEEAAHVVGKSARKVARRFSMSGSSEIEYGVAGLTRHYSDSSDDVATTAHDDFYPCLKEKPQGTFPTFLKNGLCSNNELFNPIEQNYSTKIGPYAVQVDIEIPLKRLSDRKLSLDYIPTHCFTRPGVYLFDNADGSNEPRKMYALPSGYWAQVRQTRGKDDAIKHLKKQRVKLKVYKQSPVTW